MKAEMNAVYGWRVVVPWVLAVGCALIWAGAAQATPTTSSSPIAKKTKTQVKNQTGGKPSAAKTPSASSANTVGPIFSPEPILEARDALRRKDSARLASLKATTAASAHPLAQWVDYWEAANRLVELSQSDLDAFYARWPGTYVEDRLRNDWLLELGRRQDWANLRKEYPRFRMNDDREVTCYALLARHLDGQDVLEAARGAWLAQREGDDGCVRLAAALLDAGRFSQADVWRKVRMAAEWNKPRTARLAAGLVSDDWAEQTQAAFDSPARYLAKTAKSDLRAHAEMAAVALARLAATDGPGATDLLETRWQARLPEDLAAWAWNMVARQNAYRLSPQTLEQFRRAEQLAASKGALRGQDSAAVWSDETQAWKVRMALRSEGGEVPWSYVLQSIAGMSQVAQADPAWQYWKARALQAQAVPKSATAQGAKTTWVPAAREILESIASPLNYYGQLALEDLGQPIAFPKPPSALSDLERETAATHPALSRSLSLIEMGLRNEGVREWNFTVSRMGERELLAAAQRACDRHVWDRCINTSERTRSEVDLAQRFPTPFKPEVVAKASEIGLDPAYVYGLIRQESRFIMDARSSVGASGLMQVMPNTAKWTAKKIGVPYTHSMITDKDTNLMIGTRYLKLVLDDFDGMHPLATAAYNAGPSRSRRWRDGPLLDAAAWVESIPFSETRDYVKKVLANAASYAAVMGSAPAVGAASLRARLGQVVGPRDASQPPPDKDLP
jgi:soluble lytic murein transglycosylase